MAKQDFEFTVSISLDEKEPHLSEHMQKMIREILQENLSHPGVNKDLEVSVRDMTPSQALVVVEGGIATVRAVVGTVDVALVDLDREGEELTDEDVEDALSFNRHQGSAEEMEEKLEEVREEVLSLTDNPSF